VLGLPTSVARALIAAARAAAMVLMMGSAQAEEFKVLYSFIGDGAGSVPDALMLDGRTGALFGTTFYGGDPYCDDGVGCGLVFKLARSAGSKPWPFANIHAFISGGGDGTHPFRGLVIDRYGNLYGTTGTGGVKLCGFKTAGCGIVFMLVPQKDVAGGWVERILHVFLGGDDGASPEAALHLDAKTGVLYGTTCHGGSGRSGTVFSLAPRNAERTQWVFRLLYGFRGGADGACPRAPLMMDLYGNLYGTTFYGGRTDEGTVFVLSRKGKDWTKTVIHSFSGSTGDGFYPAMGLVSDYAGNLIGATGNGGRYKNGAIYQLSHRSSAWTESVIHSFDIMDGSVPVGDRLAIDGARNVYGATQFGGSADYGTIFQLVPASTGWKYQVLYNFCNLNQGCDDGTLPWLPRGGVILDDAGNIYGTASLGGRFGSGAAFMLTR
jgi:uncharacterized repeat protein (TIGR03803 family)